MKFGEKNVGTNERIARIIAGIVLLAAFAFNMAGAPLSYLVAFFGLFGIATGSLGTCPVYTILGINTAKKK